MATLASLSFRRPVFWKGHFITSKKKAPLLAPFRMNGSNGGEPHVEANGGGGGGKAKKRLSVERIYQKKSQLEHILLRFVD